MCRLALSLSALLCTLVSAQRKPLFTSPLPTGVRLDPAGEAVDLGSLPINLVLTPEKDRAVVVLSGWREQGVQVVDLKTRKVTQTLLQDGAFYGAAFSPDGHRLCVSGGNTDPDAAYYDRQLGEFLLMYEDVRKAESPSASLLEFCQSTYEAGARLSKWDRDALERYASAVRPSQPGGINGHCMYTSRPDKDHQHRQARVRRMHQNGRHVGPSSALPGVRARWLL